MKICLSGYWSIKSNYNIVLRAFNLCRGLNAGDYLNLERTTMTYKNGIKEYTVTTLLFGGSMGFSIFLFFLLLSYRCVTLLKEK